MTQTPPPATIRNPKPKPKPKPKPNPKLPYILSGRRGCREDTCAAVLPDADHHGQRARLFVAPKPNQTNCRCEFMQPLPLPIPSSRSPLPRPCFLSVPGLLTERGCTSA